MTSSNLQHRKGSIVFMCAGFGGGIGKMIRFVSRLCLPIFENIYLLHRGRESENDIVPEGVNEVVIPHRQDGPMPIWRYNQCLGIRRAIKNIKPDVICCFGSEMAVMVSLAMVGIRQQYKIILAERGDPYTLSKPWQLLCRWAFNRADKCVFQLEKQGAWYGANVMKKSCVIPNAFIPTGIVPKFNGERQKTIVSVGRFVYEKRYEVLIQAFAKVHSLHPDYSLVLYGEGPWRDKYITLIEQLGLSDCVSMPGYANNSMSVMADASVFVLSSLYEGMPNTLIEALAVGVPTVSTDCTPGGPYFLTMAGINGLLVPVNDIQAMADAIVRIIETPRLATQLSENGRLILDQLDPEHIKNLWLNFFNSLKYENGTSN